jgi:Fungal specific transcription factor domain
MTSSIQPLEIGSLRALSPDESRFIGSSSGIFFVNTVHRAFAISKGGALFGGIREEGAHDHPSIDECIVGPESPRNSKQDEITRAVTPPIQTSGLISYGIKQRGLGIAPDLSQAKELITVYFQVWHPLFPFLHGPTFLQDLESFYARRYSINTQDPSGIRRNTCQAVVFQCVFNIAASGRTDLILPQDCCIESSASLLSLIGSELLSKHDVLSLQALLAAQLYLIVTMSLHAASTVGGILLRAIFHSGFHRCPFRYPQLSQFDREIRKRIFWTAYATDRYLSQALGHPLGVQDSDTDVCFPGTEELHSPIANPTRVSKDISLYLPKGHRHSTQSPSWDVRTTPDTVVGGTMELHSEGLDHAANRESPRPSTQGEEIFANFAMYSRITGQALELFHKSIHVRLVEQNDILMLTSDVHSWWNSLPQQLQDANNTSMTDKDGESISQFASFFSVIYQQLILLINRPFLSQDPQSPQFRSSLQTCIGASRSIISSLKGLSVGNAGLFWPGFLSGIWMSGLILAFACELGLYPSNKTIP